MKTMFAALCGCLPGFSSKNLQEPVELPQRVAQPVPWFLARDTLERHQTKKTLSILDQKFFERPSNEVLSPPLPPESQRACMTLSSPPERDADLTPQGLSAKQKGKMRQYSPPDVAEPFFE